MMQYTNGFSCALDSESGELIIKFLQQAPIIKEDGITKDVAIDEVTELIMPNKMAKQLSLALNNLFESKAD